MNDVETLIADLPDRDAPLRFLSSLAEQHPRDAAKLRKNDGLLSDVLTLAAFSPLLSTTLLQNPEYLWWLNRKRSQPAVRTKDELLEALGRFVLTHSQVDLHTQLARFRRRELLRIFLADVRRLATIAEITEDISNLADAILETALRAARQEMDNRYGGPQQVDRKGRKTTADYCIVSLGKLGSRELNYSSDIDLLFLYSAEGETTGRGTRGKVTNREYFVKLSETVARIVGQQTGEGAAYRVDLRLRPHGRVGPMAISVADAVRYYETEARDWERQVLIRSRASAGEADVYRRFFEHVEDIVFVTGPSVNESSNGPDSEKPDPASRQSPEPSLIATAALESVRRSKQLIDSEQNRSGGFNVKLGRGGIREIEFIAQALQLAYGGNDRWIRSPHTLISLARLADRGLIYEAEITELFNAYDFLRRLEHVLQMENGLQTHTVPDDPHRRELIGRRMRCATLKIFNRETDKHTTNVHRVFERVFVSNTAVAAPSSPAEPTVVTATPPTADVSSDTAANYLTELTAAVSTETDFRNRLGAFRRRWSALLSDIKSSELDNQIDLRRAKLAQTALAEASIETALDITRRELERRYKTTLDKLPIAVMGLGKLGGGAVDYESDLDLVLAYRDDRMPKLNETSAVTAAEFYSRAAEIFVTTLSSVTRDGSIYRVDLRLRPYGKNGTSVISAAAFIAYMRDTAAIWEWLAYVKIRAVAGDVALGGELESELRQIIHERAAAADRAKLAEETRRVRFLLEKEKARGYRTKDIDIKYGSGGMLDIYFAMRFLQLRDNVPDDPHDRSTDRMLGLLYERGSLSSDDHETLRSGYRFLSMLDHGLRRTIGRTTRLPAGNAKAIELVAKIMQLRSQSDLVEKLTIHRLNIRAVFENIVAD